MSKEEQMRALFEEWRASGKPRTTFARERQIPINTFHYWCQRFEGKRPRSRSSSAVKQPKAPPPAFVEIAAPGIAAITSRSARSHSAPDALRARRRHGHHHLLSR
jgi:hypothetical protein